MKKVKRYFLVFYTGGSINGQMVGNCAFECENTYVNRLISEKYIKESNPSLIGVAITNIIELTFTEFLQWKA